MLEGIRVVELGVWVAGPGAGGVLADWGADVVKLEAPSGDPLRTMFRSVLGMGVDESPPFELDNRGKRSVVLDLRTAAGREVARRLVAEADVFLTNLRPDAVERLGLGPEAVLADAPRLVYASVTGFGREGPEAHRAGYDIGAFWARSGLAAAHTPAGADPLALRSGTGDHVTGLATVAGILAALLRRERTGVGGLVETSLLRTGVYCLGWDLSIQLRFGKLAPAVPRHQVANPVINAYPCGDGRWVWLLGLEGDRHWPRLVEALGRPALADDARFVDARARRHHAAELVAIVDAELARHDRDHWAARFDAAGLWWAPVNTPADVVVDPQAEAAGAFVDVPAGAGGPAHRGVATPVGFPDDAARPGAVPGLGEHTEAVLAELGLGADAVAALRSAGALG
ncbi:MAG TPA: CaiB/BaiF CoA-transferase family protein [Acidimicrobiales bacterium]|nr:CaiB/BaiF CoA-transferase family protein [Acidimicrobiales bacterium]